jgi:hypothetical protein
MVVWLKPCKSRSSLGIYPKPRLRKRRGFSLRADIPGCDAPRHLGGFTAGIPSRPDRAFRHTPPWEFAQVIPAARRSGQAGTVITRGRRRRFAKESRFWTGTRGAGPTSARLQVRGRTCLRGPDARSSIPTPAVTSSCPRSRSARTPGAPTKGFSPSLRRNRWTRGPAQKTGAIMGVVEASMPPTPEKDGHGRLETRRTCTSGRTAVVTAVRRLRSAAAAALEDAARRQERDTLPLSGV